MTTIPSRDRLRGAVIGAAIGALRRARSAAGPLVRAVRRRQVVVVAGGPASGIRIGRAHASNDYRTGSIEVPVQRALVEALRPGDVFLDVGANVGFFTLLAARLVTGTGTVVAFEPHAPVAAELVANLARNELRADVRRVAVGAGDGRAVLHVAAHPGGSTIAADAATDEVGTVEVDLVSLDSLVGSGAIPRPDVVKIDVEGAEDEVLDGMRHLLAEVRPLLLVEIDDESPVVVDARVAAMRDRLESVGYEVDRLDDGYVDIGWSVAHLRARHHSE